MEKCLLKALLDRRVKMNLVGLILATLLAACLWTPVLAQSGPVRVLWWNANPEYSNQKNHHRQAMADFLNGFEGGNSVSTDFRSSTRGGDLAQQLNASSYDIVIIDTTDTRSRFNASDLDAVRAHYASGHRAVMLDGSFWIRSIRANATTRFPGPNGATGNLLVNQILALAEAGGGVLIGTDHDRYQAGANAVLTALIPGARFKGLTIPSTDGSFIGRTLLAHRVPVRAIEILEHWQSIPSQGEVPVGTFTDFTGQQVTLFNLVETADQPGGGGKRPYISASFDPGNERTAIGSSETLAPIAPVVPALPENMPTRKGPPS
ncbi:hypothetical protein [Marinibacterium sp. SX1]|uniref:hypothetical protein n=1 Tax=Marinibacterium sp. SX1 TaxID=3388424 RepID=UPI003D163BD5